MWLLGWTHVLSPNSTGWTFLVVILVPLFLMQLHVLDQVKAIAETQFILPFLYLPYLGFCWYTRSHRSGFLLPHLRIRGVLKWSVRWVWAFTLLPLHPVGCTSFWGNKNTKNTCWLPLCTCTVCIMFFTSFPPLELHLCGKWVNCYWDYSRREGWCFSTLLTIGLELLYMFFFLGCLWSQIFIVGLFLLCVTMYEVKISGMPAEQEWHTNAVPSFPWLCFSPGWRSSLGQLDGQPLSSNKVLLGIRHKNYGDTNLEYGFYRFAWICTFSPWGVKL